MSVFNPVNFEDNLPDLGVVMSEIILRHSGYNVLNTGSHAELGNLQDIINKKNVDLLLFYLCDMQCCMATVKDNLSKTASQVKDIVALADKLKVKVLEIKTSDQKIRVGLRQTQPDPFEWFKDKSKNQTITVKVVSTDNKGLMVRPEGCEMDFQIKKSAIAINAADARPSRWTGGEKLDCAIAEIDLNKRKVILSIKLLEEIEKKEALDKYGSEGSGKNLPFSSLSDDLKKKEENKE